MSNLWKVVLIAGGGVLALALVWPAVSGLLWEWQGAGPGMMGPWMMGGYGTMFFMPFLGLLVLGVIIWAVVVYGQKASETGGPQDTGNSALEILKARYARGEISKEEYEEKKKELS